MLMDNYQDFLMALDEGAITGYDCPIAWNYTDDHLDNVLKEVTEELVEKFDTAELTSAGVMGWLTGQRHRQLNGEKIKSLIMSVCFPLVGACGMEITFPVSHMEGYNAFKIVFLLQYHLELT